jgi:hypothetical protein
MILQSGHSSKWLSDYKDGKIPMGLGLGCDFDDYYRFKHGQFNIILGADNVGKTYWIEWYYAALAINHGLTFTIFMDENPSYKVMRDLIKIVTGKPFEQLTHQEIRRAEMKLEHHFKFIDNNQRYTPEQLIDVFDQSNTDGYLIDPFNALKSSLTYSSNYDVLNELKMFSKTGKTIYVNAHPASNSVRRGSVYPKGHMWEGHLQAPMKAEIEGGQPFANKADDFLVCHRLIQHENMRYFTMIDVVKIKDTDTGGKPTILNTPILFEYNFGLGFKVNGVDPIQRKGAIPIEQQKEIFEKQQAVHNYEIMTNATIAKNRNNDFDKPKFIYEKPDDLPF